MLAYYFFRVKPIIFLSYHVEPLSSFGDRIDLAYPGLEDGQAANLITLTAPPPREPEIWH